jgi:hypothetical protein
MKRKRKGWAKGGRPGFDDVLCSPGDNGHGSSMAPEDRQLVTYPIRLKLSGGGYRVMRKGLPK